MKWRNHLLSQGAERPHMWFVRRALYPSLQWQQGFLGHSRVDKYRAEKEICTWSSDGGILRYVWISLPLCITTAALKPSLRSKSWLGWEGKVNWLFLPFLIILAGAVAWNRQMQCCLQKCWINESNWFALCDKGICHPVHLALPLYPQLSGGRRYLCEFPKIISVARLLIQILLIYLAWGIN